MRCYFSPIRSFLPYQGGSKAPRLKTWIKQGCLRSRGLEPLIRLIYSIFNCHGWQWLQSLIRITILSLFALFFCKLYIALHQDNPNRQSLPCSIQSTWRGRHHLNLLHYQVVNPSKQQHREDRNNLNLPHFQVVNPSKQQHGWGAPSSPDDDQQGGIPALWSPFGVVFVRS